MDNFIKRHEVGHIYNAYGGDFIILEYKNPHLPLSHHNDQVLVRYIEDGKEIWFTHIQDWQYIGPGGVVSNSRFKKSLTKLEVEG